MEPERAQAGLPLRRGAERQPVVARARRGRTGARMAPERAAMGEPAPSADALVGLHPRLLAVRVGTDLGPLLSRLPAAARDPRGPVPPLALEDAALAGAGARRGGPRAAGGDLP